MVVLVRMIGNCSDCQTLRRASTVGAALVAQSA